MRVYKHIQFGEGIFCTLSEFKKIFATHLIGLSDNKVKEAHKIATRGNGNTRAATEEGNSTNSKKS